MRRRLRLRFVVVLVLLVVGVATGSSGVAQEATPTMAPFVAGEGTPVTDGGTPVVDGDGAPVWTPAQACPDPGAVDQSYMIEDAAGGSLLTIRLLAGSREVDPWAGAGDAIARVKWGRVCIEPDTTISAEDGGDERYSAVYVVYVEAGELYVSLTPDLANGGYAYLYDGNDETQVVTGQRHAQAGDMIVMANTFATFANPSADDPATIVAVQVAPPGDETGCTRNCWIPSCFMPVAQEPPTCAGRGETAP